MNLLIFFILTIFYLLIKCSLTYVDKLVNYKEDTKIYDKIIAWTLYFIINIANFVVNILGCLLLFYIITKL